MSRKKRDLLVISVLVLLAIVMLFFYNYVIRDKSAKGSSGKVIMETTTPEPTYSDEIDNGPVKVGEEITIDAPETNSDSISIEVDSDMSDFKSNAGKAEAGGLEVSQDTTIRNKKELTANVDWSDYEINDSELIEMLSIGARLVEIDMNESGKYGSVQVTPALPNVEELKEFTAPIYYSVSEDGVLTVNAKLEIVNKDKSTYKEILTPISMYYEGNVVKLKK